ncbi:hypothetical protein FRB95_004821 [Tulasnella sp. JGI-2019a]|nr:hypothetical protein FRB95_004821 [Tulasnella sp. JGI-2019a]
MMLARALSRTSPGSATNVTAAAARLAATSRHLSTSKPTGEVNTICLFGAGLMGAGIAQVAAHNGFKVILCDVNTKAIDNGKAIIQKSLSRIAKKAHPDSPSEQSAMIASVFENITTSTDPVEAVANADLVVEAIVENLKIKQDLFALLDRNATEKCIFTSNTSSLAIKEIAQSCSGERRKRFGGVHFFNPVYVYDPRRPGSHRALTSCHRPQMKLVEVIKAAETSDETIETLLDVCRRLKKTPVNCKDTPGFIVNRLLVPYMFEAMRLVERGDATAEDVDVAMKLGAGYPMGPLELADFVGLDTCHHILSGWREKVESGEEKALTLEMVAESKTLTDLVKQGKLGRKSSEGFFKY